jgi:L-glyceraldehyde 3-phosphate reductase
MKLDYVDIFYSHRVDPGTPFEETMGALDTAVRRGKALYAGISSYNPEQTKRASKILRELGTPCLIHQPKYSMFNRGMESGLLSVLEKEGIGCITFCPLDQGILTDRYLSGITEDSRAGRPTGFLRPGGVTEEKIARVRKLNEIAHRRGQTMAQMALAWILRLKQVTSVLIGASRSEQIKQNAAMLQNLSFTEDELLEIEGILA